MTACRALMLLHRTRMREAGQRGGGGPKYAGGLLQPDGPGRGEA